ncbi:hypothetical protein ATZ33_01195 [Enterococcus silesiacus]|uniref:Zinc finger CGNR domain-containing protein n=1 Tax=Enterococcus silesiacus TaxID=332949 RepID=A0A0S3K6X2_9ENTE|nr:CGNR zinc finger domain-containing protein [Enterococcus silesiacus]ALS00046.1 hypothetical protein ATZ33_01195 [Enterococcus silesiacus]OJG86726.1 hypothetical protein RV15_GL002324 [Enterococcus silesiacus]
MSHHFPDVSDCLLLDFINTKISKNGKITELIHSKNDLSSWFDHEIKKNNHYSYQLMLFKHYFEKVDDISSIIAFRDSLHEQLSTLIIGENIQDELLHLIKSTTKAHPFSVELINDALSFTPITIDRHSFESLILLDLAQFISNGDIHKLSRCSNPECVLLFVDRTGRRKWCSMKICGNRHKVEAFAKRKKQASNEAI